MESIKLKCFSLLSESSDSGSIKIVNETILGKRKSFGENVEMILKREEFWTKWKENKCAVFEKPKDQTYAGIGRKRT